MINKDEIPKCPSGLGREGKVFWKKIVGAFILENHHLKLLHQACKTLDDLALAEAEVTKAGRYLHDRFGQLKENPACLDVKQLRNLFRILTREIGLDCGLQGVKDSRPPRA